MPSGIERGIFPKEKAIRAAVFTTELIVSATIGRKLGGRVQTTIDRGMRRINGSRDIQRENTNSGNSGFDFTGY